MSLFSILFVKILPLYFSVFLGFIGGKFLRLDDKNISILMIYIIVPVAFFGILATSDMKVSYLPLPLISFFICSAIGLFSYYAFKKFWNDGTENLLVISGGSGNVGYFGLPVAFALFSQDIVGAYMLFLIGLSIFQCTVGYYFIAKTNFHIKEAIYKTLCLPILWATIAAFCSQLAGIKFDEISLKIFSDFKSAYSVLGMMLVGIAMSRIRLGKTDWGFVFLTLGIKFIIWPLVIIFIIFIDRSFLGFYTKDIYKTWWLFSLAPLAAATVAYSVQLGVHPEKVSISVFLSTIIALFYIPFMYALFFYI